MNFRQIPNTITLARIALSVPIVLSLLGEEYALVLLLLLLAGLSDGLDGWLVRRYGWYTRLGGYLDPLADKILVLSTYLTVAYIGLIPWWLVLLVMGREVVIVGGALLFRLLTRSLEMQPLFISKVNTFAQIVLVLSVIIDAGAIIVIPVAYLEALFLVVAGTTIGSGLAYMIAWGRKAWQHGRVAS
ncbi:cardiolipin synthase [Ectothiorhodosinus mongolicus]|uniref:CDP-diacylglycerol--glycerol-3-phosphate 3-phosphatidyltransferase n=1 Tax=Ectothiorhodosinus mongolicus TaxID=233100 RepID=A0A1R3VQV4_9GAMM|nr:CDP-alcohol phosphatidyltransferase family protein [Ectothiorhodosinus mongolicus]ULX56583.1 CDP-alcohol phosphatidyltransferase [Ectothiorhodosinus mongolicus]SIT66407.1 cardiolipin synthase [Ectothiorhodosinus mongolicus]